MRRILSGPTRYLIETLKPIGSKVKGECVMSLTPRDRVCAQIQHQETDPIPYTLRFDGDVAEQLDIYYGSDEYRYDRDAD